MARNKSLTNEKDKESMVVMLEGYPEDDIDATLGAEEADLATSVDEAMGLAELTEEAPAEDETTTELIAVLTEWEPTTSEGKRYKDDVKSVTQEHMKRQGYDARLDERLAMEHGKESGKEQSYKSRRDESRGAEKE